MSSEGKAPNPSTDDQGPDHPEADTSADLEDLRYANEFTDNKQILQAYNVVHDLKLLDANCASGTVTNEAIEIGNQQSKEYNMSLYVTTPLGKIVPVFIEKEAGGNDGGSSSPPPELKLSEVMDLPPDQDICTTLGLQDGMSLSFGTAVSIFFIIDKPTNGVLPFRQSRFSSLLYEAVKVQRTDDIKTRVKALVEKEMETSLNEQPDDDEPKDGDPKPKEGGSKDKKTSNEPTNNEKPEFNEFDHLPINDAKAKGLASFFSGLKTDRDLYPFCIARPKGLTELAPQIKEKLTYDEFVAKQIKEYQGKQGKDPKSFDPLSWLFTEMNLADDPHAFIFTQENQKMLANANIEGKIVLQPNAMVSTSKFVMSFYGTTDGNIYPVCWANEDFLPAYKKKFEAAGAAKETAFADFEKKIPKSINIVRTFLAATSTHIPYEREDGDEKLDIKVMAQIYNVAAKKNLTPELYFVLMKGPYGSSYPVFVVKDVKHQLAPKDIVDEISRITILSDSFLKSDGKGPKKEWKEGSLMRVKKLIKEANGFFEEERKNLRYLGNGVGIQAPPTVALSKDTIPLRSSIPDLPKEYKAYKPKATDPLPDFNPAGIHGQYYGLAHSKLLPPGKDRKDVEAINDSKVANPVSYACCDMEKLATVTLGKAVIIPRSCFQDCRELTSVTANMAQTIAGHSFRGCVKLTDVKATKATTVGEYAFAGCSELVTVPFDKKAQSIGEGAFRGCSKLTKFDNKMLEDVSDEAFMECAGMIELPGALPVKTKSIGNRAFQGSGAMDAKGKPLVFKAVEGKLGSFAFNNCSLLTTLKLEKVTSIGASCFGSCKALTKMEIPLVTEIEQYAFRHCTALTTVTANKLEKVGGWAFHECTALKSFKVDAPGLKTIGEKAFYDCELLVLKEITNFESIGFGAFCQKKEPGYIKGVQPPPVEEGDLTKANELLQAFGGEKNKPLITKLPAGLKKELKFSDVIIEKGDDKGDEPKKEEDNTAGKMSIDLGSDPDSAHILWC